MNKVTPLHCRICGGPAPAASRCTNGHCANCHQQHCTPGGATYPGHGVKVYAVSGPDDSQVLVIAGKVGFHDCEPEVWLAINQTQDARQTAAALFGSLFGWHTPGARVENYGPEGQMKRSI